MLIVFVEGDGMNVMARRRGAYVAVILVLSACNGESGPAAEDAAQHVQSEDATVADPRAAAFDQRIAELEVAGTDGFVLREWLECLPVEDVYYCPLNMWTTEPNANADQLEWTDDMGEGDMTFREFIDDLETKPLQVQYDTVLADLKSNREGIDKAIDSL